MTLGHAPDAGEANARLAAEIVGGLYALGARHAVVSPGSRNTPSVLALHAASLKWSDFHVHVVVDERSASFFALGICRATSSPVILSCSSGSAGTHYHPAFVEASRSDLPLVAITADRPAELHDRGAPQTVAQHDMLSPHSRLSRTLPAPAVGNAASLGRSGVAAIRPALIEHPRGPVHLNVQAQEPLWPHDWSTDDFVALYEQREATPSRRPRMEPASVFAPIRASLKKTRGLILAGPMDGVRMNTSAEREQLRASTRELSEQLGFPVLADPCSQLRTSSADHVIGSYDIFLRSDRFQEEAGPDVVVTMGEWPTSKVLGQFIERHQPTVISLQEDQNLRDPWDVVTHQVRVPYTQLTAVLADDSSEKPSGSGEWLALWKQADELAQKAADGDSSESLWEGAIARELVASLAAGTVLHVGSSMPIRNLDAFMDVCPDDCPVFSSRGANGIDGTIATAAGEAAGSGRNVLAWMGDLTFLHDAGSLAWIAGDTPLTILVTDNGGGGIFEHLPIATNDDVFEPYFITPPTASVSDVARGYGWEVETVDTTTALRDSLTESRGRRKVIVARVDRQENMTHYKSLWQRASGELDTLFGRTTPR